MSPPVHWLSKTLGRNHGSLTIKLLVQRVQVRSWILGHVLEAKPIQPATDLWAVGIMMHFDTPNNFAGNPPENIRKCCCFAKMPAVKLVFQPYLVTLSLLFVAHTFLLAHPHSTVSVAPKLQTLARKPNHLSLPWCFENNTHGGPSIAAFSQSIGVRHCFLSHFFLCVRQCTLETLDWRNLQMTHPKKNSQETSFLFSGGLSMSSTNSKMLRNMHLSGKLAAMYLC